jgi:hypothetical protein
VGLPASNDMFHDMCRILKRPGARNAPWRPTESQFRMPQPSIKRRRLFLVCPVYALESHLGRGVESAISTMYRLLSFPQGFFPSSVHIKRDTPVPISNTES